MKVRWTEEALGDVEAALDWLESRNPQAAARLLGEVLTTVKQLAKAELDGPEAMLTDETCVRSWPVPPMRIYYQRREGVLWVLRVYDQRRQPISRH